MQSFTFIAYSLNNLALRVLPDTGILVPLICSETVLFNEICMVKAGVGILYKSKLIWSTGNTDVNLGPVPKLKHAQIIKELKSVPHLHWALSYWTQNIKDGKWVSTRNPIQVAEWLHGEPGERDSELRLGEMGTVISSVCHGGREW